jgi:RsiW-degrading membrane proteinase PrsW (M82 family)
MATTMNPSSGANQPAAPVGNMATASPMQRYWKDILWVARLTVSVTVLAIGHTLPSFWHQLSCLIILAVLAWPVRSVRWGTLYNLFVLGFFFSFPILGLQYLIEKIAWGGQSPILGSALIAPLTEEPGKILPLLLLLAVGRLGYRNNYGACDLMLCGVALGAGFGFFEDSLRLVSHYPTPNSPSLFGIPIFPDSYSGFLGHSASTGFIGLALGCLLYAVRWRKWLLAGIAGVLFVPFWMMVDHGLSNYATWGPRSHSNWLFLTRWIWDMDRQGKLSPYVFFTLLALAVVAERVLLWRMLKGLRRLSLSSCLAYVKRPWQQGWGYSQLRAVVWRIRCLQLYVLSYRQLAFLMAHWKGDLPPNRRVFAPLIARCTGEVAITQLAVRES